MNNFNTFFNIPSQSSHILASDLNQETEAILPSNTFQFTDIKLYELIDGNYILRYEQNPINDSLWNLIEPSENRFNYTLIITDDLLD